MPFLGGNQMKLPNGYGGISKLPGNRRKPWRVRKTDGWEIVDGKLKQKYINIGYYKTQTEALQALASYNTDPYDLSLSSITLEEVYERWSNEKFEQISDSNIKGYKASWKICNPIKDMRIIDIKLDHLQNIVDTSGKNTPTLRKLKVLLNGLFEYAVIHGIITRDRNMVEYINISKAGNPNATDRKPFSTTEIKKLWAVADSNEYITVILMLIYTGCRIGELLNLKKESVNLRERYFEIAESKTEAGIRTVPIALKVLPFFENWMQKECEYLVCTPSLKRFDYKNYYDSYWKPLMHTLNMDEHRPHDTRHTCISLLTAAKVDERFIQKIVGHKGQNVTRQVYTHLEIEELLKEIDKI